MRKSKRSEASSESSDYEDSGSEEYLPVEASDPVLKENMDALMKQLKTVLVEKEKTKLLKGKNPILVCLNKYTKILEQTRPEEHKEYFLKVYKRYRIPILANKNDRWLRRNQVKIVYGDSKFRVMLSAIYNIACNLADEEEKRLEGLTDDAYEECVNLIRKDIILLHLYRVFKEFAPETDQDQLSDIIAYYEDLVGLEVSHPPKSQTSDAPKNPMGAIGDLLNNLVSGLNSTAKENNVSPEEIPDLGKVMNDAMNNDAIKGVFQSLMTKLSDGSLGSLGGDGGNPLEEIMKGVSETISAPGFTETMSSTMSSIVDRSGPRGPALTLHTTPDTSPNGPAFEGPRGESQEGSISGPGALRLTHPTPPTLTTNPVSSQSESTLIDVSGFSDLPAPPS